VGLLSALADRGNLAARPAVLQALSTSRDLSVRVASIHLLGQLGMPEDSGVLVELLGNGTKAEQNGVRQALVQLRGVSATIIHEMGRAVPATRVKLIQVLVTRRDHAAVAPLNLASLDKNATVRMASMAALGELGEPKHVAEMLRGVLRAEKGAERGAAEKAVMFVCARIKDADKKADPVLDAMKGMSRSDRTIVLSVLGRVGGAKAFNTVTAAIESRSAEQHSAGIRALSNWPDAVVAPRLIALVKTDKHPAHRITALRALIRIAPLPDGRTDVEKLSLLQKAMTMCTRSDERHLALQRASAIRTVDSLRFLVPYLDQDRYAQRACLSIVELAHHRGVREPNEEEFHEALERVLRISRDATVRDRAKRYKNAQTWGRPSK
jgi:HEAT repeat protein